MTSWMAGLVMSDRASTARVSQSRRIERGGAPAVVSLFSMADPASRTGIPPRPRRIVGTVAFLTAFVFLTGGNPLPEFRSRLGVLRRSWRKEARARRLEGTAAAYDRRFAAFLDSARDALPSGTPGLALYAPGIPEWGGLFLAVYQFAPTPVLLAPERVPPGWLVLSYGGGEPRGGRVLRQLADGALLLPPP
jgi:hypothetical protein